MRSGRRRQEQGHAPRRRHRVHPQFHPDTRRRHGRGRHEARDEDHPRRIRRAHRHPGRRRPLRQGVPDHRRPRHPRRCHEGGPQIRHEGRLGPCKGTGDGRLQRAPARVRRGLHRDHPPEDQRALRGRRRRRRPLRRCGRQDRRGHQQVRPRHGTRIPDVRRLPRHSGRLVQDRKIGRKRPQEG